MYIEPNSTIELFKDLRLDDGYANTMWFEDVGDQNAFFVTNIADVLIENSYQRKDIGVFRCKRPISEVFDVNYMRFKNVSFENKWFYAFVNRVEYVNNNMCNIYYTIDVIQTYMFDWTLHECMIERQHSTTDVAGDNLQIEGLELGNLVNNGNLAELFKPQTENYSVIVCLSVSRDIYDAIVDGSLAPDESIFRGFVGQMPYCSSLLQYYMANTTSRAKFFALLDTLSDPTINQIDSIASIIFCPTNFSVETLSPTNLTHYVSKPTSVDGHTPVNKKLLTYPYCFLEVYNDANDFIDFHYEYFNSQPQNRCKFTQYFVPGNTPNTVLFAQYLGKTDPIEHSLAIDNYPQVVWANDGYKAWLAMNYDQKEIDKVYSQLEYENESRSLAIASTQNKVIGISNIGQNALGLIGNLTGATMKPEKSAQLLGASGSNIIGGIATYSNTLTNEDALKVKAHESEGEMIYKIASANNAESVAKRLPNSTHLSPSLANIGLQIKGFYAQAKSITKEYATRIDKYFTMFGYAQNKVDTPNIHVRRYFTYIKTSGCAISGSIPQDDRGTIEAVFDRGIRFWTDYSKFEDYTVSNTIL